MPILKIVTQSPEETRAIGLALGGSARPGFVYLMSGELGAGKTTLTQGVLEGLGSDDKARSPTFVLATEYEGRLPLYHIDLYRIDAISELSELGLDEYFEGNGLSVVEWADKAAGHLPAEHLSIHFEHAGESSRRLRMKSTSPEYMAVLDAVREVAAAQQVA